MPILIPQGISVRPAKEIITQLKSVLSQRRRLTIGRREFLTEYRKLRSELELTPEYAEFHAEVCFRAKGICERCSEAVPKHVHHKVRVSYAPELALNPKYAQHVCLDCHKAVDASHRRWLKNAS